MAIHFEIHAQIDHGLNTRYMLRSTYYVLSENDSINAKENNLESILPIKYSGIFEEQKKEIIVIIDTLHQVGFEDNIIRFNLYVINNSDSNFHIPIIDEKLFMIAEVLKNKKWCPIQFVLESNCGNSYSDILFKQHTYWKLYTEKYAGNVRTKLRMKLKIQDRYVFSNEIWTNINLSQLEFSNRIKDSSNSYFFDEMKYIDFNK